MNPRTNARGKRYYTASDKVLIQQIAWLVKDQGYTIDGARKAMKKRNEVAEAMAATAEQAVEPALDKAALLSKLYGVKEQLERLKAQVSE